MSQPPDGVGDRRRCRGDRGESGPVEVVIIASVLLMLIFAVVAAGRVSAAKIDVQHAARSGARAAAMRGSTGDAIVAAEFVVESTLHEQGVACASSSVSFDGDLQPGGRVTVTVRCTVDLGDLTQVGVPGSKTYIASASEVVDAHRGGG